MASKNKLFSLAYTYWLPFLSGILLTSIQPPASLFPIAFFALIPLLGSINKDNLRYSFFSGYAAGVVSYLGLIYWVIIAMNHYGGINIPLSALILLLFILYLSCYTGLFTLSCAWLEKRFSVLFMFHLLSYGYCWNMFEDFLCPDFPGLFSLIHNTTFFPLFRWCPSRAPILYPSLLLPSMSSSSASGEEKISFIYITCIVILCAVTLVYGFVSLAGKRETPQKKVAIIQGNIRQNVKWDEAFKIMTIKKYIQMTQQSGKTTDLIVWPETAMPFIFDQEIYANRYVKALPSDVNATILFGTISKNESGRYRNSAYVIGKLGDTIGVYSKVHLVPFGEYTPLLTYLPFLEKLDRGGRRLCSR